MHTWKHKSCAPYACAISCTRCTKGHLQMRSSALFWYLHISWRATIPSWYLQASSTPFMKFFVGSSPHGGSDVASPLLDVKGPTSTAILANTWVREDPGDLPAASNPSNCLLLLSYSLREGGVLPESAPRGTTSPAHPWYYLHPCHLRWSSNQSEIMAGFSKLHMVFSF